MKLIALLLLALSLSATCFAQDQIADLERKFADNAIEALAGATERMQSTATALGSINARLDKSLTTLREVNSDVQSITRDIRSVSDSLRANNDSLRTHRVNYRSTNFAVSGVAPQLAREIADAAEFYYRQHAIDWLGRELPPLESPCEIIVTRYGPGVGNGGTTSYAFHEGQAFGFEMSIQGTPERLIDSVVCHEVLHIDLAKHFGTKIIRWADEGACATVEHPQELANYRRSLKVALTTGRGIPFSVLLSAREYPADIESFYAQSWSLALFLALHNPGKRGYVEFVRDGMQSTWTESANRHYGYESLTDLQTSWLDWVSLDMPSRHTANRWVVGQGWCYGQSCQPRGTIIVPSQQQPYRPRVQQPPAQPPARPTQPPPTQPTAQCPCDLTTIELSLAAIHERIRDLEKLGPPSQGARGETGATGATGAKGETGAPGRGITKLDLLPGNILTATYTDGKTQQIARIDVRDGIDGRGVARGYIAPGNVLMFVYSDGREESAGTIATAPPVDPAILAKEIQPHLDPFYPQWISLENEIVSEIPGGVRLGYTFPIRVEGMLKSAELRESAKALREKINAREAEAPSAADRSK